MTEEEKEKILQIEEKLIKYLAEATHPNMLVFSALNKFDTTDVAAVLRGSVKLGLTEPQKDMLLRTFIKRNEEPVQQPKIVIETFKEFSNKRKKRIRHEFATKPDLTVQDFLKKHTDISEASLRNILDRETWESHYVYSKVTRDWDDLVDRFRESDLSVDEFCAEEGISVTTFRTKITKEEWDKRKEFVRGPQKKVDWDSYVKVLQSMPDKGISEFCREQGLNLNVFKNHCPAEVWDAHSNRRKTNWDDTIEKMKASGRSYQTFCKENNIPVQNFRNHCSKEILDKYDEGYLTDMSRIALFDPSLPVKDNAEILGVTQQYMSVWINSKLKELCPEKFQAMLANRQERRKSAEDIKIEEQSAIIEDLNTKISEMEADYLKRIDALREQINDLKSKNGSLQTGITSLKVQLGNEKRKNQDLAKKIKAFADSLIG